MQGSPRPLAACLFRLFLAALIVMANAAPGGVAITLASSSATQGQMSGHAHHADAMSHAHGGDLRHHEKTDAQSLPDVIGKLAAGTHIPGHDHGDTTQAECCQSFCFPALASETASIPLRMRVKPDSDRGVHTLVAALAHGPERPPRV